MKVPLTALPPVEVRFSAYGVTLRVPRLGDGDGDFDGDGDGDGDLDGDFDGDGDGDLDGDGDGDLDGDGDEDRDGDGDEDRDGDADEDVPDAEAEGGGDPRPVGGSGLGTLAGADTEGVGRPFAGEARRAADGDAPALLEATPAGTPPPSARVET